jgi:hypothetical protein
VVSTARGYDARMTVDDPLEGVADYLTENGWTLIREADPHPRGGRWHHRDMPADDAEHGVSLVEAAHLQREWDEDAPTFSLS